VATTHIGVDITTTVLFDLVIHYAMFGEPATD
jgi:hypothetical protein